MCVYIFFVQDYRLPPLSQPLGVPLLPPPPSDIVESVDMDLSEDEERKIIIMTNIICSLLYNESFL